MRCHWHSQCPNSTYITSYHCEMPSTLLDQLLFKIISIILLTRTYRMLKVIAQTYFYYLHVFLELICKILYLFSKRLRPYKKRLYNHCGPSVASVSIVITYCRERDISCLSSHTVNIQSWHLNENLITQITSHFIT